MKQPMNLTYHLKSQLSTRTVTCRNQEWTLDCRKPKFGDARLRSILSTLPENYRNVGVDIECFNVSLSDARESLSEGWTSVPFELASVATVVRHASILGCYLLRLPTFGRYEAIERFVSLAALPSQIVADFPLLYDYRLAQDGRTTCPVDTPADETIERWFAQAQSVVTKVGEIHHAGRALCLARIAAVREAASSPESAYLIRMRLKRAVLTCQSAVAEECGLDAPRQPSYLQIGDRGTEAAKRVIVLANEVFGLSQKLCQPSESLNARWTSGWRKLDAALAELERAVLALPGPAYPLAVLDLK